MAGPDVLPDPDGPSGSTASISIGSHDTALCIIPPKHQWASADRLRMLYDKAYEKWPPHVNLIYPFVPIESLPRALDAIASQLKSRSEVGSGLSVVLDVADVFPHRHDNTIFIYDSDKSRTSRLGELRKTILKALGQKANNYQMHMTVGQSEDCETSPHKFLLHKAKLVPSISWETEELCILVRERMETDGGSTSQMKLWGTINLKDFSISRSAVPLGFYNDKELESFQNEHSEAVTGNRSLSRTPFIFSSRDSAWKPYQRSPPDKRKPGPDSLRIASYNVLAEFNYPPSQVRYPVILENLLHQSALSDVLVLQEVTDDFLCHLLQDERIRGKYPFVSNGPPDQADIDPLPNLLNIIVLSKWSFTWDWVSFKRKHKGSVVLQFDEIGKNDDTFVPAILATIHLTRGLSDGSVAAKKIELKSILKFLSTSYPQNPWIMAGDFNITTSAYTVEAALKKKAISAQTALQLASIENILAESGFSDSWTVARLEQGDSTPFELSQQHLAEVFEGEQGATFDPTSNKLASDMVGSGFNNRPQRYDRILVKGDVFSVASFNLFGRSPRVPSVEHGPSDHDKDIVVGEVPRAPEPIFASDHWGIRCTLKLNMESPDSATDDITKLLVPVQPKVVPESLANSSELRKYLDERGVFPSGADIAKREQALKQLREILLEIEPKPNAANTRSQLQVVIVPVGSYGLGVWTTSSDVDCLCIGPISSRTFFALASQRLRKTTSKDVKILRRVNAHSGTMLELEIQGIKMDLHYCPSAWIAETWPQAMGQPANSPIFTLPAQTLAKLKPVRDLYYLRRTIPDLAVFRTVYHLIKAWAKQRGIYSARFGYLGGIHISILLSRVCKLLSHNGEYVSVPSIVATFFNHYANFDWKNQMVFDPFFHKRLRYTRTVREPLVILGYHAPSLNTAHTASLPSVRTISEELKRADELLSTPDISWSEFLGERGESGMVGLNEGSSEFLTTYKSYVKIDVQFWGVSLAKGSQYVGWLESRCVMLLVDLNRRLPNVHARIWPARFVAKESSEEDRDYQGYYLIGLDKWKSVDGQSMSKEDIKITMSSLQTVLHKFEGQIRGDEKYFDATSSWMSASVVKQSDLGDLILDGREWGEYALGDDDFDDDEDDEDEALGTENEDDDETETTASAKKTRRRATRETPTRPAYVGKFRSSVDVMNRIRWDPDMDSGDHIVGYLDRFLGAQERSLDLWKTEQTDEEFIPQHRILYFKRRSDGVVVWDRESRRDAVFGSGVKIEE